MSDGFQGAGTIVRKAGRWLTVMGIVFIVLGMLAIVEPGEVDAVTRALTAAGETVWTVGDVVAGERGVEWIPA